MATSKSQFKTFFKKSFIHSLGLFIIMGALVFAVFLRFGPGPIYQYTKNKFLAPYNADIIFEKVEIHLFKGLSLKKAAFYLNDQKMLNANEIAIKPQGLQWQFPFVKLQLDLYKPKLQLKQQTARSESGVAHASKEILKDKIATWVQHWQNLPFTGLGIHDAYIETSNLPIRLQALIYKAKTHTQYLLEIQQFQLKGTFNHESGNFENELSIPRQWIPNQQYFFSGNVTPYSGGYSILMESSLTLNPNLPLKTSGELILQFQADLSRNFILNMRLLDRSKLLAQAIYYLDLIDSKSHWKIDQFNLPLIQLPHISVKDIGLGGELTHFSNFNLEGSIARLHSDFFGISNEINIPKIRLVNENNSLFAYSIASLGPQEKLNTAVSVHLPLDLIDAQIRTDQFNLDYFLKHLNIPKPETKPTMNNELPDVLVKLQVDELKFLSTDFKDLKGRIHVEPEQLNFYANTKHFGNSPLGFTASLKDNLLEGSIHSEKYFLKDFLLFSGIGGSGSGHFSLNGDLSVKEDEVDLQINFTNKETVFIKDSVLQKLLWQLPVWTSKKSKEEIIRDFQGSIIIQHRKDKTIIDLGNTRVISKNYHVFPTGKIVLNYTEEGEMDMDYDLLIDVRYNDWFRERYVKPKFILRQLSDTSFYSQQDLPVMDYRLRIQLKDQGEKFSYELL